MTEFAKDKTFGYKSSNMCEYVEEKTKGEFKAADVTRIALEDIRNLEIDKIAQQLMAVKDFNKVWLTLLTMLMLKYLPLLSARQ